MGGQKTLTLLLLQLWLIVIVPATATSSEGLDHRQHSERKVVDDNNGFISIDCGMTDDHYTDETTGIYYDKDEKYSDTSRSKNILIFNFGNNVMNYRNKPNAPKQEYNLRYFPVGEKNCYTFKPANGRNNKYLIRATFRYGNYDYNNTPPVFDLYLGANLWATVNVQDSDSMNNWYESIHVPDSDYIHVCLVNTNSGVPYITTLELRPLNSSINYYVGSGALATKFRYYVGKDTADTEKRSSYVGDFKVNSQYLSYSSVKNGTADRRPYYDGYGSSRIRYGEDVYDRIWSPLSLADTYGFRLFFNTSVNIQNNSNAYFLPNKVLTTASIGFNSSACLTYSWNNDNKTKEYHIYFHFNEIEKLPDKKIRKVVIFLNGVSHVDDPISLEYLKPVSSYFPITPSKEDSVNFSICSPIDSTLPPILNAFEIFTPFRLSESSTASEDVDAVMAIKSAYLVPENWQGDPCLPNKFTWDGLICDYNNSMRIVSLNLSSRALSGKIKESFFQLKAVTKMDLSSNSLYDWPLISDQLPYLTSLDLSNNPLKGLMPDFMASFPSLMNLNLSDTQIKGHIPRAVKNAMDDGQLKLSWDRNPGDCSKAPCKNKWVIPVVSILSVLAILVIVLALWWKCKRSRRGSRSSIISKNQEFTYSQVVAMTDNFKTVIGEGGFGKVYLGTYNNEQVAVKLHSFSSKQGLKEFRSEAQLLMRVHHGNLVSLIGYCDDGKNMALIYEYMPNGDLRQHLSVLTSHVLTWMQRLQVARDAAQGLEYLHNGCKPPIIHRDVKPANILLNRDFQAKIADFGLSRDSNELDTHSTNPAGTMGYMDPEYMTSRTLNKKSDVYSFGIVLLELITGQQSIVRGTHMTHVVHYITPLIEKGDIQGIVDPRLQGEFNPNSAWKAVEIAMACIPPVSIQRPDMCEVLFELKECIKIEMSQGGSKSSSIELAAAMDDGSEIYPSAR